ncbi:MAG: hypothetical protein ACTH6N_04140 [Brachybacterium tyrofermentans]|uniref:Uncharacterized protein n=1 Tax=Brachybacterium tyrofermentans TaxID=47848 RepID=A0ABW0FDP1_9MICO|nr:hypothetical protein [Brachybacterium tyrofermentans]
MTTYYASAAASPSIRTRANPASRWIGVGGTALVLAYAVFAALQIQVLNPLAAVPGSSLREISAAVGNTADTMGWGLMIVVLALGPLIAVLITIIGWRGRIPTTGMLVAMLGLLMLGTPAYFVASFPAGMTLADTFGIGGADHSPWAGVLHLVSLLALIALVVIAVRAVIRATVRSVAPGNA